MSKIYIYLVPVLTFLIPALANASPPVEDDNSYPLSKIFQLYVQAQAEESRDDLRKEFLKEKPDLKVLSAANAAYMEATGSTPLQAAFQALGDRDLCHQQPLRALWLIRALKKQIAASEDGQLTPYDHYAYAAINVKVFTWMVNIHRQDAHKMQKETKPYEDKAYKHFKWLVSHEKTIPEEGLMDCYLFLSQASLTKKLYEDNIRFTVEFLRLNKIYNSFQVRPKSQMENKAEQETYFRLQHGLAMSYVHCKQYDKAVEAYKVLLEDNHLYSAEIKKMGLEELFVLFELYFSVHDLPSFRVLEPLILNTLPHINPAVMRSVRVELTRLEKEKQTTPKKAGKKKPAKQKMTNKEELSAYMVTHFIRERIELIHKVAKQVSDMECVSLLCHAQNYGIDQKLCEQIRKIEDVNLIICQNANGFKGKSGKECLEPLQGLLQQIDQNRTHMRVLQQDFKKQLLANKKFRRPSFKIPTDEVETKHSNLKAEVMAVHDQTPVKEKTRGEAHPPVVVLEQQKEEGIEQANPLGSIQSCSEDVETILDTQMAWDYPNNAVECLNLLRDSKNIRELSDKLKAKGAKLKMLRGKNKGTWQFRVNDQYRIRFNLVKDCFENVQIGDFH